MCIAVLARHSWKMSSRWRCLWSLVSGARCWHHFSVLSHCMTDYYVVNSTSLSVVVVVPINTDWIENAVKLLIIVVLVNALELQIHTALELKVVSSALKHNDFIVVKVDESHSWLRCCTALSDFIQMRWVAKVVLFLTWIVYAGLACKWFCLKFNCATCCNAILLQRDAYCVKYC